MYKFRILPVCSVFLSALMSGSILYAQMDEPDYERENRLHQVYKQFNEKPTEEKSWTGAVTGKTQTYSIQEGDTLWDLSDALFGDSQFWPKVWSLNAEKIENPHEIFPGLSLYFTPGTTGEAPTLAVKPSEKMPEASDDEMAKRKPKVPETDEKYQNEILSRAELPPEKPAVKPTQLPSSVPYWTFGKPRGSELQVELKQVNRNFGNPEQPLTTFVSSGDVQGVGSIAETEMSQKVASDFQYVYVKFNQAPPGKTFYVARSVGEIKDPSSGSAGQLVQVAGELELLDVVNSGENLHRALVKNSVHPVEVGSQIFPGPMPRFNNNPGGSASGSAQIVGGQYDKDRNLFSSQMIVFLSGQGLNEGQTYPIYKKQKVRNEKTQLSQNPLQIGRVKVLKVSPPFATGVILQSSEDIQVGDVTNPQQTSM